MFGTIIGDIIGSRFEFMPNESREFDLFHSGCNFTDDTICQTGVIHAMSLISAKMSDMEIFDVFEDELAKFCNRYPAAGYGSLFVAWLDAEKTERRPYGSYGNGCIMRDAPCIWLAETDEDAVRYARLSSLITHNDPNAVATTENHARLLRDAINGASRSDIVKEAVKLGIQTFDTEELVGKKTRFWDAKRTFALAISLIAKHEQPEDVLRDIVLIGSDTDTTAAIAMQFEEAFGNIPDEWIVSAGRYFGPANWSPLFQETARAFLRSPKTSAWLERTGKRGDVFRDIVETNKSDPAKEDDIFSAHARLVDDQRKTYSSPITRFFARWLYNDKTD